MELNKLHDAIVTPTNVQMLKRANRNLMVRAMARILCTKEVTCFCQQIENKKNMREKSGSRLNEFLSRLPFAVN